MGLGLGTSDRNSEMTGLVGLVSYILLQADKRASMTERP